MSRIDHLNHLPVDPALGKAGVGRPAKPDPSAVENSAFRDLLAGKLAPKGDVAFSAHARDRIRDRNIDLSSEAMERLTRAVDSAAAKGARDALVLMPGATGSNDLALVVSVTNRTVITAMDGDHIRENVFTNIDSAVVAR